jgi:hypothetical protein
MFGMVPFTSFRVTPEVSYEWYSTVKYVSVGRPFAAKHCT